MSLFKKLVKLINPGWADILFHYDVRLEMEADEYAARMLGSPTAMIEVIQLQSKSIPWIFKRNIRDRIDYLASLKLTEKFEPSDSKKNPPTNLYEIAKPRHLSLLSLLGIGETFREELRYDEFLAERAGSVIPVAEMLSVMLPNVPSLFRINVKRRLSRIRKMKIKDNAEISAQFKKDFFNQIKESYQRLL
ncbi:MAG: hypothetical protein LBJ64_07240 [Deltaproteobacteria bacterium]|nr:hypothetical protein [Deltaproteobacteria bacterium]